MPDRYGDNPEPDEPETEATEPDTDTDHQAAARRGMDIIRHTMGWK